MIQFQKYHGIGNDFLIIETTSPKDISVARAMELCDRHFGVGGDGVLIVSPADDESARARMTVINADGSRPEMCGNGLRCVALYLAQKDGEEEASFVVQTDAGPLRCDVERQGTRGLVGTEIGQGKDLGTWSYQHEGAPFEFRRLSTGNPHAVCFRGPIADAALDQLGSGVSANIVGGANVEIATMTSPVAIQVAVWERGVGRTLACGTGAAAVAIAATWNKLSPIDTPIEVRLPGGPLMITVSKDSSAYLRGPAEWIYSGETAD
jgi:diaminopimelate epimerase